MGARRSPLWQPGRAGRRRTGGARTGRAGQVVPDPECATDSESGGDSEGLQAVSRSVCVSSLPPDEQSRTQLALLSFSPFSPFLLLSPPLLASYPQPSSTPTVTPALPLSSPPPTPVFPNSNTPSRSCRIRTRGRCMTSWARRGWGRSGRLGSGGRPRQKYVFAFFRGLKGRTKERRSREGDGESRAALANRASHADEVFAFTQLRAEYERMNRESLEKNVEALVKSRVRLALFLHSLPSLLRLPVSSCCTDTTLLTGRPHHRFRRPRRLPLLIGTITTHRRSRRRPRPLGMATTTNSASKAVRPQALLYRSSLHSSLPSSEGGTDDREEEQTPINPATNLVVTSQLAARNGAGAGNLIFKLQHNPSSKLSLEVCCSSLLTAGLLVLTKESLHRRSAPPSSVPALSP